MSAMTLENSPISDIQYVKNYDEKIGILYEEAKASYIDAPIQTLVSLRSLVHEICKDLYSEFLLKGVNTNELAPLLNKLDTENELNGDVISYMREIKANGDKAAHKHQLKIKVTMDQYREMSVESTRDFCKLIDCLNSTFRNDFSSYDFDPKVPSYLEKLSYQAIFESEPAAIFKVGVALIEQVITCWSNPAPSKETLNDDGGKIRRGVRLIKEAADKYRYPDAMFEYAVMSLTGKYIDIDIEQAMKYFYHAASLQHNQAKAYFGCIALEKNYSEDIPLAIDFLMEAAAEQNPYALTKLGELYANGDYVEFDINKSTQLLENAASQDFPLAYYQLALNKWKNQEFDLTVELFKKSKAFGYDSASLQLAKIYASTIGYQDQALAEFRNYKEIDHIDFLDYLKAVLEYEQYKYSLNSDSFQALEEYLLCLTSHYRQEQTKAIAPQIEAITPLLLKKYHQMMINNNLSDEAGLLFHFLPSGKPYKSFNEINACIEKAKIKPSLLVNFFYSGQNPDRKQLTPIGKTESLKLQVINKKRNDKAKRRQKNKRKKK